MHLEIRGRTNKESKNVNAFRYSFKCVFEVTPSSETIKHTHTHPTDQRSPVQCWTVHVSKSKRACERIAARHALFTHSEKEKLPSAEPKKNSECGESDLNVITSTPESKEAAELMRSSAISALSRSLFIQFFFILFISNHLPKDNPENLCVCARARVMFCFFFSLSPSQSVSLILILSF